MMSKVQNKKTDFKKALLAISISQALMMHSGALQAEVITVDTADDDTIVNGNCTLREAIAAATANSNVDACIGGDDDDDRIVFDQTLEDSTITLAGTELSVASGLTIDGDTNADDAPNITVDADDQSRVFHIDTTESVILNGLTVTNGGTPYNNGGGIISPRTNSDLTITNSRITSNGKSDGDYIYGAGIFSLGNLTMTNVEVSDNRSYRATGAGLYVRNATLTNCQVTGNRAEFGEGGGVFHDGNGRTDLVIRNSVISNNSAEYGGAGVLSFDDMRVENSTFDGNVGRFGSGGAINNDSGNLTVIDSTLVNNSAGNAGGAITSDSGNLTIVNSTIAGNHVGRTDSSRGGTIFIFGIGNGYSHTITSSTIANNTARNQGGLRLEGAANGGTFDVINSIIAGNTGEQCNPGTNVINVASSLVGDGSCGATLTGDPQLGELADNGGSTLTMLPANSSPAVNAGDNTDCGAGLGVETDQRGKFRDDGACDLGAVEIEYNAPPSPEQESGIQLEAAVQVGAINGVFLMLLAGLYRFRRTLTGGKERL
ncbi:Uncharacterised protein [BD1-7 clade bacterium]|uniref:CSLREA domain-containing protein n=1 Tax=BD1-7 clade bacterium TaxID=2029982 RepID=A0A5S9PAX5_9GAMM|nr:Uncharacterised protein [BD1-7 clade bacterium]